MPTKKAKAPTPYCHVCGSHYLTATSSQQRRKYKGKMREVADVICGECTNQWWSVHPAIRALARAADKARKDAA